MIQNKKGFTLIELIIVMAIIGILAVVAIVAISGKSVDARNARRLADMSAVQTGMALTCITGTTTSVTCTGTAASLVALNTCDPTTQLNFEAISDPKGTNTCDSTPNAVCNYAIVISGTDNVVNSCDYLIHAWLEVGGDVTSSNNVIQMSENAITRSATL